MKLYSRVSLFTRSFIRLITRALPVCLMLGSFQTASAQEMHWSDPATWPGNEVPSEGDRVTIATGQEVTLDVTPPALGGLTINGKLSFADESDLELTTESVSYTHLTLPTILRV